VQTFIITLFLGIDAYSEHSTTFYTVLQDTTYFPSFIPGTQAIGAVLSNINSTLPFFEPVKLMLALAFAALSPMPAPIVIVSGVTVKPLPRPKLLEPACSPPVQPRVSTIKLREWDRLHLRMRRPPSSLFRNL
jgi:hypothetical protein